MRYALIACLALGGCGYHIAGKADLVPKSVHTIAIPAFTNATTRYRLTERMPGALSREFLTRSRYRIVADPNDADAVLTGSILNFVSYPTVFDPATGRASGVQLVVFLRVKLTEKTTGKVIYERPSMEVRERYEIAVDPKTYFEESDTALERLSRDVARTVVSAVLEGF